MSDDFIKVENLHKSFQSYGERVDVLKGVNLSIPKGDIYGVIGFSGAGKSTLIRCMNRLEEPDRGRVEIGGTDITALPKKELNRYRQKVGMIFQQFNLFDSKTVFENVAYPLKLAKYPEKSVKERVDEVLELVGIFDKKDAFPNQLSGGQKQRVGIARALANEPDVLLSDEATSALDPQTTLSVLDLLKEINQKLGLTILLITHELEAIKYACRHMAVLEDGVIVEKGAVKSVFFNPHCETGKVFLKVYTEFKENDWREGGGI